MIVLGRFTTTSLEHCWNAVAPTLVIPSGTVIPVNVDPPIEPIDDSPVKRANSWNAPAIAEVLNLTVPKVFVPWELSSKQVASEEE